MRILTVYIYLLLCLHSTASYVAAIYIALEMLYAIYVLDTPGRLHHSLYTYSYMLYAICMRRLLFVRCFAFSTAGLCYVCASSTLCVVIRICMGGHLHCSVYAHMFNVCIAKYFVTVLFVFFLFLSPNFISHVRHSLSI